MLDFYRRLPGLYKRTACAKMIGLVISLIFIVLMNTIFEFTGSAYFLWGLLLWYPTLGGIIGIMGVMDKYPILNIKLTYIRGAMIGGFMNLLLGLMAFEQVAGVYKTIFGSIPGDGAVFCGLILEGVLVGLFMDYVVTKKHGEGEPLMHLKGESGYDVKLHDSEL